MSEAAKRCGIPFLALTHALLAIGLVLNLSSASGRQTAAATTTLLTIPAIHIAVLVSAETLVRQDPRLIIAFGAAILAELAAAVFLIARQNANFAMPKDRTA